MNRSEAEPRIMAEMKRRLPTVPYTGADGGMVQFLQLQQERPELFSFRSSADKWQVVHGWMLRNRLVTH